jgi:hypothetical protein
MAQVNLNKTVFEKRQYQKVIDTSFSQLKPNTPTPTVATVKIIDIPGFFQSYNQLFFDIPKLGDTNSHEYIVKTSQTYVGTAFQNDDMQALIDEVTFLKQQNLDLTTQIQILSNSLPK